MRSSEIDTSNTVTYKDMISTEVNFNLRIPVKKSEIIQTNFQSSNWQQKHQVHISKYCERMIEVIFNKI